MSSYLNSQQKAEYEAVMQNMHDTFARTIYAYKDSKKIIVSTDPNFNFMYNNAKGVSNISRQTQFKALSARVLYMDKQNEIT